MNELNSLREREKELNCLYRLQEVLMERQIPLAELFESVVEFIGEGWQRPSSTGACVDYFGRRYRGNKYREDAPVLSEPLRLGSLQIGSLSVSDSSDAARSKPENCFLPEERKLLRSLATFISEFLERRQLTLLEPGFTSSSNSHWRWRERVAQSLVNGFDSSRFGPADFYLGGSTERGEATHGSDIDLAIEHRGSPAQKLALKEWLNGWSTAVAEMARLQTGEHFPDGILNLTWLDQAPTSRQNTLFSKLTSETRFDSDSNGFSSVDNTEQVHEMVRRTLLGLSHELRNPLTVISADLSLLKENLSAEEIADIVSEIEGATSRMSILITDLMLLLRAETGTAVAPLSETEVELFLAAFEREFRVKYPEATHVFFEIPPDNLQVLLNQKMASRILTELICNAVYYSSASKVVVSAHPESDGAVVFTVVDNGCGIDKAHQDKLFERFYRPDASRDRRTGGVGLGLPLARALARSQNADLRLESSQGSGTRVCVVFPPTHD